MPSGRQLHRVTQQRNPFKLNRCTRGRCAAHFQQMAEEPESSDVGHGVYAVEGAKLDTGRVELRRACDELAVRRRRKCVLAKRGAVDADAERFAEDQRIAWFRAAVPLDTVRMDAANHRQTVDRLDRIDRVAAGDRNAGFRTSRCAARNDRADHIDGEVLDRHRHQRQREQWRCAHRIDVGDRVGRRNRAEIVGIIHDRHEKIGRCDDRLRFADTKNRGIVGGLDAYHQFGRHNASRRPGEYLLQHARRDLAAASAAV